MAVAGVYRRAAPTPETPPAPGGGPVSVGRSAGKVLPMWLFGIIHELAEAVARGDRTWAPAIAGVVAIGLAAVAVVLLR